jgi:hypothetical protein
MCSKATMRMSVSRSASSKRGKTLIAFHEVVQKLGYWVDPGNQQASFEPIWLGNERPKSLIFRHAARERRALLTSKAHERDNAITTHAGDSESVKKADKRCAPATAADTVATQACGATR